MSSHKAERKIWDIDNAPGTTTYWGEYPAECKLKLIKKKPKEGRRGGFAKVQYNIIYVPRILGI